MRPRSAMRVRSGWLGRMREESSLRAVLRSRCAWAGSFKMRAARARRMSQEERKREVASSSSIMGSAGRGVLAVRRVSIQLLRSTMESVRFQAAGLLSWKRVSA